MKYLYEHPQVQAKVRAEILAAVAAAQEAGKDNLDYNDITGDSLPYFDAFVKEILRCEPPVVTTVRSALQDEVVPLLRPLEGTNGELISHLTLKKDNLVLIQIRAANYSKDVFGDDADEFRPERWLDGSVGAEVHQGVWSQQMTFLDGPRACIGYKMSLYETKAILITLLRTFEFLPRDADVQVERRSQGLVAKPLVVSNGEEKMGFRMPLKVRLLATAE